MRFGFMVDTHRIAGAEDETAEAFFAGLVDEARTAEAAGVDGIFVPERHARPETLAPDPLMLLTALAMATSTPRLGTFVLQPGYYHPAHLAEQTALLDVVSGGRLVLGLGSGYHRGYFEHFGTPFEDRGARLDETLAFLERAWSAERFDWAGPIWPTRGTLVMPAPVQAGGPPIWLAGTASRAIRRAARRSCGLALMTVGTSVERIAEWIAEYRAECRLHATAGPVAALFDGFIGADDDEAERVWAEVSRRDDRAAFYSEHGMLPADAASPPPPDRPSGNVVVGGVEAVARRLGELGEALGLGEDDWLILKFRTLAGPSRADSMAALQRYGAVLDRVRAPGLTRSAPAP